MAENASNTFLMCLSVFPALITTGTTYPQTLDLPKIASNTPLMCLYVFPALTTTGTTYSQTLDFSKTVLTLF